MSEIKRVSLTTLEPQRVSDKVQKKSIKTIRISVILPESNEDKCPEYNYKDELAAVKRKGKSKPAEPFQNGTDPFGMDEDDSVRRIAIEMEAKYGGAKKKRKGRKDDYADIGMGYDESDSFIDNTDGYDEIIPQNVTTLHGGFYINSGALEFKTDDEASSDISSSSDTSDDDGNEDKKEKPNRKRVLETTSEEEDEENGGETANKNSNDDAHADKKPKLQNAKNSMQQAIKKKLFSQNKIQVKKRRPIDPLKKTVKELLREKRQDLNLSVTSIIASDNEGEASDKDNLKENKKPMCITSVTDAIESVVKATIDEKNNTTPNVTAEIVNIKENISKTIVDAPSSLEGESSHESTKIEKIEIVKLPENLSSDIREIIDEIKKAAVRNTEGKVKFFTEEVNQMLLKLERKCKCLGKSSRTKVYEHLSPFVKCRKETLIRRAKNLVLEYEEKKLSTLLVTLKTSISQIMPTLRANYESERQKQVQRKLTLDHPETEENKMRMPKRRFQWNDETKKYMKEILFTKKRCFLLEGKQKNTYDEHMTEFLKKHVQPLWPEGWISMNALKKICASLSDNVAKKPEENNKHSPCTINTNNLTIIPLPPGNHVQKMEPITNDLTFSKIVEPSQKLPPPPPPDHNKNSKKDEEKTIKTFDVKNFIKDDVGHDNSVIVVHKTYKEEHSSNCEKKEINSVIENTKHCQVIDLTDSGRKPQQQQSQSFNSIKESSISGNNNNNKRKLPPSVSTFRLKSPPREFFQDPNLTFSTPRNNDGDEIQMVMENLKALQKLSSPIKSENSTSSPVSVIAYNKNFSPKSNHSSQSVVLPPQQQQQQRTTDFNNSNSGAAPPSSNNKGDFSTSFQDEFQKQLLNSLSHLTTPTSSKTNYNRCS